MRWENRWGVYAFGTNHLYEQLKVLAVVVVCAPVCGRHVLNILVVNGVARKALEKLLGALGRV